MFCNKYFPIFTHLRSFPILNMFLKVTNLLHSFFTRILRYQRPRLGIWQKIVNPGQTCKEAFKHFDIWNLYVWLGSISDINCKMPFKTKYQTTFWLQMMFIAATSFYTWSVIFKQCSENWLKITWLKIQKTTKTKLFSGCLFHTNILSSLSFPNSKYFYVL